MRNNQAAVKNNYNRRGGGNENFDPLA